MDQKYAEYLLKKTARYYNQIADHFSMTRSFIWKDLKPLAQYVFKGDKVLDIGCGNGRLLQLFEDKNIDYIGVDGSEKLIEIAKKKYPKAKFKRGNALDLLFPNNYFDKIYSIAVLHHIPSKDFRLQFLLEAKRVLKPEGLLIGSVWNLWPRPFFRKLFLRYTFLRLIGKSKLDFKDVFYPWKNQEGAVTVQRYVHAFDKKELGRLTKKAGFKLKKLWVFKKDQRSNIFLVAEK